MSVVSAYYYLRVVVAMYMHEPRADDPWARVAPTATVALSAVVLVVLGFGVFPGPLVSWARRAAQSLLLVAGFPKGSPSRVTIGQHRPFPNPAISASTPNPTVNAP